MDKIGIHQKAKCIAPLFFLLWYSFSLYGINTHKGFIKVNDKAKSNFEYYYNAGEFSILLSSKGFRYVYSNANEKGLQQQAIDVTFLNANPKTQIEGINKSAKLNYYKNGQEFTTHQYEQLSFINIYNQIDLHYFINSNGNLKYEFHVKPGGDPNDINLIYKGLNGKLNLNDSGCLIIKTSFGQIKELAPICFDALKNPVKSSYVINSNQLKFNIANYDKSQTLIIDPYIEWSTFLGGINNDEAVSVSNDRHQNLYVLGHTFSPDFPNDTGLIQKTIKDSSDVFLSKFNEKGKLIWSTFVGGSKHDSAVAVKSTLKGDVFVLLNTYSNDLPVTKGALQKSNKGTKDAYLAKIDSAGHIIWATYIGGTKADHVKAMSMIRDSILYLTGFTTSSNFPTSLLAHQKQLKSDTDAFIMKIDTSGSLIWSTYFGGNGRDVINAICPSDTFANRIFLAGYTQSTDFDSLKPVVQDTFCKKTDALIACFNHNGKIIWSTYYGGSGIDKATGIVSNYKRRIFIIGNTSTTDTTELPVIVPDTFQENYGGGKTDGFLLTLDYTGKKKYFMFYGGNEEENLSSIDFYHRAILISGSTKSNDLFINHHRTNQMIQRQNKGGFDGFYIALDTSSRLLTGSYLGSFLDDKINQGIFYNGAQTYVGASKSIYYPTTDSAEQRFKSGENDMILTTICGDIFKTLWPHTCHDGERIGALGGDDFKGFFEKHYRWQNRTLFDWVELENKDSTSIFNQFIKQKTFYRRIYSVGLCTDTSWATANINGPEPKAIFTYSGGFCLGDTIFFKNSSTVTYGSMRMGWYFGGDGGSIQVNPYHVFTHGDTTFKVRLTVTADSNCTSTLTEKIYIANTPKADFKIDSLCNNDTAYLISKVKNSKYYTNTWIIAGRTINSKNTAYLFKPKTDYTVTLISTAVKGCADTITKIINIDSALVLGFNLNNTCPGDSIYIQNTSKFKKPLPYYKWFLGQGDSSVVFNPVKAFDTTGTYFIKLVMKDKRGCIDTLIKPIIIRDKPIAQFSFEKDCKNDSFFFRLDTFQGNGYRYTWNIDDEKTFSTRFPFYYIFDSIKDYKIDLIATINGSACPDTLSKIIWNDSILVADFEVVGKCDNQAIHFKNKTKGENDSTIYSWRIGNDSLRWSKNYTTQLSADSFNVWLIAKRGKFCEDSILKAVEIFSAPNALFSHDTVCLGKAVQFNNLSNDNGIQTKYRWFFGNLDSSQLENPSGDSRSEL